MLTPKLQQTFHFIEDFMQKNSYAPTCSEIAAGIGIKSRGVVHRYVSALAGEGLIRIVPGHRRNIEVVAAQDFNSANDALPFFGSIAAGQPIDAIENREVFSFSEELVRDDRFVLKVKGDSMIGDNICDGDYVICQQCSIAPREKIVVVLVEDHDASLKRINVNSNGTITLIPSNSQMKPMLYPADQVAVQGMYVGLVRMDLR
jgi:repressor LexA